jgi:hypothetical protein
LDQGANILRQEYSITGLDQVTKIIDRDWAKFVAQAWPDVCKAIETSQQQSQAQAHLASNPRDQNIFNDLETFVWDRFNQDLRQDLEHCVFRDYSTLDTLQAWIQNSTKLSCTPEY